MQTNTLLSSTKDSVKIIKTIFYWQSKEGRSCHCLLRIYIDEVYGRTIVIASELDSNRQNTAITQDIKGLASTVMQTFGAQISVPREQITWIVHYGDFSQPRSYENIGFCDEFSRVDLPWQGTSLLKGESSWTVLRAALRKDILGWLNLEPVEQVLTELASY